MTNSRNATIVLLTVTAAILGALLVGTWLGGSPETANAAAASVRGGEYVMGAAQWNNNTDLVFLVNTTSRKLLVYYIDPGRKIADVTEAPVDLDKLFGQFGAP